jgi:hypothetical protein
VVPVLAQTLPGERATEREVFGGLDQGAAGVGIKGLAFGSRAHGAHRQVVGGIGAGRLGYGRRHVASSPFRADETSISRTVDCGNARAV